MLVISWILDISWEYCDVDLQIKIDFKSHIYLGLLIVWEVDVEFLTRASPWCLGLLGPRPDFLGSQLVTHKFKAESLPYIFCFPKHSQAKKNDLLPYSYISYKLIPLAIRL